MANVKAAPNRTSPRSALAYRVHRRRRDGARGASAHGLPLGSVSKSIGFENKSDFVYSRSRARETVCASAGLVQLLNSHRVLDFLPRASVPELSVWFRVYVRSVHRGVRTGTGFQRSFIHRVHPRAPRVRPR